MSCVTHELAKTSFDRDGWHYYCSVGVPLPLVQVVSPNLPPLRSHAFSWESSRLVRFQTSASRQCCYSYPILTVLPLGMYPGLVFYLTFWYRPEERSLRIAVFLACASLAGAFGGTIAYAVGHMNGVAGLAAWRWLFILEGVPTCLFAIVILLSLPDFPESATWLNAEEKALAADRMRSCGSKGGDKAMTWVDTRKTLTEWRLYAHYLVQSAPFISLETCFKLLKVIY